MGHGPVVHEAPGHCRKYPAASVAVVGGHARMGPDHGLVLDIDLAHVVVVSILANVDCGDAALDHLDKAGRDVAALAFGLKYHAAAVCGPRIGSEHAEEIW